MLILGAFPWEIFCQFVLLKARQSVLLQKFFLWAFFQLSLIFMESPLRL